MEDTVTITRSEYEALQRKGHGWQIMDASTGLFSTGGMHPRWTKGGKVYDQKNHVLSHIRLWIQDHRRYDPIVGSWISFYDLPPDDRANLSFARELWEERAWYHPEDFVPRCWRVVDPGGNIMTVSEVFSDSMRLKKWPRTKLKELPEEWR